MSKQVTLDEMLDIAHELDLQQFAVAKAVIEGVGTELAALIAAKLGVAAGPATFEGSAFAGTCAPFFPLNPGDPCPSPLDEYDQGGDWE